MLFKKCLSKACCVHGTCIEQNMFLNTNIETHAVCRGMPLSRYRFGKNKGPRCLCFLMELSRVLAVSLFSLGHIPFFSFAVSSQFMKCSGLLPLRIYLSRSWEPDSSPVFPDPHPSPRSHRAPREHLNLGFHRLVSGLRNVSLWETWGLS